MIRIWYLLAGIFGIVGVLTLAGVIERFINGDPWVPGQTLMATLSLLFAFVCFNRGRAASKR
jgi:hypothetical protein